MPNQETARHAHSSVHSPHIYFIIFIYYLTYFALGRRHRALSICWPATAVFETSVINQTQLAGGPEAEEEQEFRIAAATAFAALESIYANASQSNNPYESVETAFKQMPNPVAYF